MSEYSKIIHAAYKTWVEEEAKFETGIVASASRARKALGEMNKAIKARRLEVSEVKKTLLANRKASKAAG